MEEKEKGFTGFDVIFLSDKLIKVVRLWRVNLGSRMAWETAYDTQTRKCACKDADKATHAHAQLIPA